jgi:hypothetical protein
MRPQRSLAICRSKLDYSAGPTTLNPRHHPDHYCRDDVNELMTLIDQLRGFPSSSSGDVYGLDTKLELNSFEIQWANDEDETVASSVEEEQKTTFKDIVDSIEALGRQFAKNDAI